MVLPLISPVTVQLKVKVSPGQVGGAAVNCPVTSGKNKYNNFHHFKSRAYKKKGRGLILFLVNSTESTNRLLVEMEAFQSMVCMYI